MGGAVGRRDGRIEKDGKMDGHLHLLDLDVKGTSPPCLTSHG